MFSFLTSLSVHHQTTVHIYVCSYGGINVLIFQVWAKDAPEALQNNQVEFVPLNFLEESPVQGQDVYYVCTGSFGPVLVLMCAQLRNIIHNWPDAEAAVILKNTRNAMAPHSRLLIRAFLCLFSG